MTSVRLKVAVLYNAPVLPPEHPDAVSESDVVGVAQAVVASFEAQGWDARLLAASPPVVDVLHNLDRLAPDVVFNLIEGFGGSTAAATHMTGLLELAGYPYTGSPLEALALCVSKGRAKCLLRGAGLPTAPGFVMELGASVPRWDWSGPAIVKPDAEDGSLGIDQASVVLDWNSACARVAWIHATYGGSALVEAYLPGPEYNVGVLALPEPVALPIAEVAYESVEGTWPILTYAAKWSVGSAEDRASPVSCPARIERELAESMAGLAVSAFKVTGCRDYARVDLRLDGRGEPIILEVNPNPDIGPTAGWARALRASGRDYAATLAALASQAVERARATGAPLRAPDLGSRG
ncbi:D-alanine--D-alanine ligase family protein [Singulisphaera acidiphila]|uniref:ATP-grasp enzyme, D-alanine-D-alanine ligase n=1 Tax=Singulisphaera acidiphila (strain ATCC BAA-1392 / DSM 18658 / VKM B-2454 / MOB10) TaxID=886293 RepID=L0DN96_SINAD|nr:ATP-grasp enzyme, D-alanine-D-alanine ligase [Singulisphaera acidiphila]AGA30300.1 ATP-grasp enzyme, D-alanine-D-alanine ligase [Singulisphaera acidiphila DSM 18658]